MFNHINPFSRRRSICAPWQSSVHVRRSAHHCAKFQTWHIIVVARHGWHMLS